MNEDNTTMECSIDQQNSSVNPQQQINSTRFLLFQAANMTNDTHHIRGRDGILSRLQESSWLRWCTISTLFTSIAITIGVIIVCLTSPKIVVECQLTFKRLAQHEINYDSHPQQVTVGDMNNDSYPDIIVANSGTDNVGILLRAANGSFASQITYSTGLGSRPYSVVVGDFNNDHQLDIVVANYGTNSIGLHLGYGNGSQASPIIFSLGSSRPLFLAAGDFNNDHQPDIAAVNAGTSSVTVLLGSKNGSFHVETIYDMGYDSQPYSLVVGDFNNDTQLDIAIVNYGTSDLVIILRNGNGTFVRHQYSTGHNSHSSSLAVADFDNDRTLDIAVANIDSHNLYIFLGHGDGTFPKQLSQALGYSVRPQCIVAQDINKDTNLDIIVGDLASDEIIVLGGHGDGIFSILTTHSTGFHSNPISITYADFDHDNRVELIVANRDLNDLLLLSDYSVDLTVHQKPFLFEPSPWSSWVAAGDFDNDDRLDIVATNIDQGKVVILMGDGYGNLHVRDTYTIVSLEEKMPVVIGDFNNDHHTDIAFALSSLGTIGFLFGYGNGTFNQVKQSLTANNLYIDRIAANDLDNDGALDIILTDSQNHYIAIYFGVGDGTFTEIKKSNTGPRFYPKAVACGDFNNDHILDFIVSSFDTSGFVMFLGNGNRLFRTPIYFSTDGDGPIHFALGDLNNDKRLDIVYTSPESAVVGVLFGFGNGTFANITRYSTALGSYPFVVALGDFNNDTLLDIVIAKQFDDSIGLFLSFGDDTFSKEKTFYIDNNLAPYSLAVGDFNRDNRSDIVIGSTSNGIVMLLVDYEPSFTGKANYPTSFSAHPYSIAFNDFNNNSQADMVIANSGTNDIEIRLDYNNGAFMNKTIYSTGSGSYPHFVTVTDFNNDFISDIAVVNRLAATINVFYGFGNGTFDTASVHSTGHGSSPSSLAVADLNKDGWIDMIVTNEMTDNFAVYLGFKYTTFTHQTVDVIGRTPAPQCIAVGDFNHDGLRDMVVANEFSNNVVVFLANENGTFRQHISYGMGFNSAPRFIVVDDFNNDHHLDMIVTNPVTRNIKICLGDGNGYFSSQFIHSTSIYLPKTLAIGDFNNDSRLDIVVTYEDHGMIGILLGYGNGSFVEQIMYDMGKTSSPKWVAVSDFNNDQLLDIAVANFGANNTAVLLGYGNGSFANPTTFSTGIGSGPISIAVGDFDKDNRTDIAVANSESLNVAILFGYGNGSFSSPRTYLFGSGAQLTSILASDINGDEILDILVSDSDDTQSNVRILYGSKYGDFGIVKTYSTGSNTRPTSIAVCDFNNDGKVDMAITYSLKDKIGIMLQYKYESFAKSTAFPIGTGSHPTSVAVGDFDNDDYIDLVVAYSGRNRIGLLFGQGNGRFDRPVFYPTGDNSRPSSVAVGDFNRDDYLDIAIANTGTDNIGIFLGYGKRTFANMTNYSTGISSSPSSIAIADMNNDYRLDLVVANRGISSVLVFFGANNGTFSNSTSYSVGYNAHPQSIAIGDINNDSLLDIAVANNGTNYVEILLQTC